MHSLLGAEPCSVLILCDHVRTRGWAWGSQIVTELWGMGRYPPVFAGRILKMRTFVLHAFTAGRGNSDCRSKPCLLAVTVSRFRWAAALVPSIYYSCWT